MSAQRCDDHGGGTFGDKFFLFQQGMNCCLDRVFRDEHYLAHVLPHDAHRDLRYVGYSNTVRDGWGSADRLQPFERAIHVRVSRGLHADYRYIWLDTGCTNPYSRD